MAPGAKHRELVVASAKQAVGRAAHDEQAFRLRPEFAEDANSALNEKRTLDEALLDAMREIVQLPDVVTFELEANAMLVAELAENGSYVAESAAEHPVFGPLDIRLLPRMLPADDAARRLVEGEIHRAHVDGAELRLGPQRIGEPFLERHPGGARGRDADDRIALGGDDGNEFVVRRRIGRRAPVGISGVQV